MQINIATGNAVINATQNSSCEKTTIFSTAEEFERYIRILKRHLGRSDIDEQIRIEFEKEIAEAEEELEKLRKE